MTMNMEARVAAVRAHARAHYNEGGWDFLEETYTDEEIAELLERHGWDSEFVSLDNMIRGVATIMELHDEHRSEVLATIW